MERDWSLLEPDNIKDHSVLNLADLQEVTSAEGPGRRFAIWLQGCSIRCPGCWNPHMWSMKRRHLVDIGKLLNYVKVYENKIDGVTILGGEPLAQVRPLRAFVETLKKETDLSVLLYTGYEDKEIVQPDARWLVEYSDIVVFGPFIKELKKEGLKWIGSENQYIRFNNPAYEKCFLSSDEKDLIEIIIDTERMELTVVGYPDDSLLKELLV